MKAPSRVVLECTAKGWSVSVYAGDRLLVDNRWGLLTHGSAKAAPSNVELETALDGYDELVDAIDEIADFGVFDVSGALLNIREERDS